MENFADKRKNKKNKDFCEYILSIVYLFLLFLTVWMDYAVDSISFIGYKLTSSTINELIVVIQLMLLVIITVKHRTNGFKISIILSIINCVAIIIGMYTTKKIDIIPCLFMIVGTIILLKIINTILKQIDINKDKLYNLACTDYLTGLYNRRGLRKKIDEYAQDKSKVFALVYIDLNDFKAINDSKGHDCGDEILCQLADRWRKIKHKDDFIARLDGDEFALITEQFSEITDLIEYVNKFLHVMNDNFIVDFDEIFITASLGIAIWPMHTHEVTELIRYADIAMANAKNYKAKSVYVFTKNMIEKADNDVKMASDLRTALEKDLFNLVFQPQFDISTKKLRGFETLLRLSDSVGNPISPAYFIHIAEKKGLIEEIDKWVLLNAMIRFKPMITKYNDDIILSINISASHLLDRYFLRDIKKIIEETGFPTKNLELEITESVFISSMSDAQNVLNKLTKMGVKIALDDFGTGYASLGYLTKLPISLLKIDKSFIDGVGKSDEENDFVKAIISMGHILHFEVIAEGVEEEKQRLILNDLGCDLLQGFLWGKPMELNSVIRLIKNEQAIL